MQDDKSGDKYLSPKQHKGSHLSAIYNIQDLEVAQDGEVNWTRWKQQLVDRLAFVKHTGLFALVYISHKRFVNSEYNASSLKYPY